jgi:hypothetical protein
MEQPCEGDIERVTRAVGMRPTAWRPAAGHGAPSNRRWVVDLPDGTGAFVKIAAYDYTADWLRNEHANYVALIDCPHVPRLVGWDDDGDSPALAIEDLSDARWPPPWTEHDIGAVREALDAVHDTPPPRPEESPLTHLPDLRDGWAEVRDDPEPFLAVGFAATGWIEAHLDALDAAARRASLEGASLLHMDVRSDNLCLRGSDVRFVDWNMACAGDATFDLAAWLPSLADEAGIEPWRILPDQPELAAMLAGYFCCRAGRPPIPQAPHARPLQRSQGHVALRWAARELGLPPPA